jgi:plastocyanin
MRRILGAAVGLALVAGLAACGGDDGGGYTEPKGPAVETIEVKGRNFAFDPDDIEAPAGILEFELESEDNLHTLVIEGVPGFQVEASGGKTDSAKVELKKGKYTFYCDIPGHRTQGMEGTITVR